jgi:putative phosphoesterase
VIIGLLSDTHGRHQRTAYALGLLEQLGAEAFVHCGDLGGEKVLDQLAGRRTWFVWGNIDAADPLLERYARTLGLTTPRAIPLRFEIAGRSFALYHGHEPQFSRLSRNLSAGSLAATAPLAFGADYIIHGHTHRAADIRVGETRLINPGALERARAYTVATLDVSRDVLRFWQFDEHANANESPRPFTPR